MISRVTDGKISKKYYISIDSCVGVRLIDAEVCFVNNVFDGCIYRMKTGTSAYNIEQWEAIGKLSVNILELNEKHSKM